MLTKLPLSPPAFRAGSRATTSVGRRISGPGHPAPVAWGAATVAVEAAAAGASRAPRDMGAPPGPRDMEAPLEGRRRAAPVARPRPEEKKARVVSRALAVRRLVLVARHQLGEPRWPQEVREQEGQGEDRWARPAVR